MKTNCNMRYATDSVSSVILRQIAEQNTIPLQEFAIKCDSKCGTTVGPILNSNAQIKTVDIGIGQLAMHSIREICGTTDALHYYTLFKAFYQDYDKVNKEILDS